MNADTSTPNQRETGAVTSESGTGSIDIQ